MCLKYVIAVVVGVFLLYVQEVVVIVMCFGIRSFSTVSIISCSENSVIFWELDVFL